MKGTRPMVRTVGGKSWAKSHLLRYVEPGTFSRFHSTCVGGGAFELELFDRGLLDGVEVVLADIDVDLMNIYAEVRDRPARLARRLQEIREEVYALGPREYFALTRRSYNVQSPGERDPAEVLWLRYATYSGLWRHSLREGKMNVSGRPEAELLNLPLPELAYLKRISGYLKRASLLHRSVLDYDQGDLEIGQDDLIFVDPPYAGTFTQYQQGGFTDEEQIELLQQLARWGAAGAQIIYTQNDNAVVRSWLDEYWPDAHIEVFYAPRTCNADTENRGPVPEVFVSTHLPLSVAEATGSGKVRGPS